MRKGYLCYRIGGKCHDLIAGSILVGPPGLNYECTHGGNAASGEGLAFRFAPALIESMDVSSEIWRIGCVPPIGELMVIGELAQAVTDRSSDIGLDEVGLLFAVRLVEIVSGRKKSSSEGTGSGRRRAIEAALWIHPNAHDPINLETTALLESHQLLFAVRQKEKGMGLP